MGRNSKGNNGIEISWYIFMHICTMCPKYFQSLIYEILCSGLMAVRWQTVDNYNWYMTEFLSSKGLQFPNKQWNRNFLVICISSRCFLYTCTYKGANYSVLWFNGCCSDKLFISLFSQTLSTLRIDKRGVISHKRMLHFLCYFPLESCRWNGKIKVWEFYVNLFIECNVVHKAEKNFIWKVCTNFYK